MKVKSLDLTKNHAMKTYWVSRGIASHILNLGTRWTWVVSFTLWPLYPQHPLDRRCAGPRAGLDTVARKRIPDPAGNQALVVQPVA